MNKIPLFDFGEPEARMQQVGRWTYRVWVRHGFTCYGPDGYGWHVLGRARAERKARRVLARYQRREVMSRNEWTVPR